MGIPTGILSYSSVVEENIGNFERTDAFSIEMWVKATADKTNATLISHMANSGNPQGWGVFTHGSRGKLQQIDFGLYASDSNRVVVTNNGPLAITNNNFFHVVITYDGSSLASGIKYYVDGILKSLIVAADNLTNTIKNNEKLLIGTGVYYPYFQGVLDEVVIYNRVLSASEVSQRYNSGAGREDLIDVAYAHYHLNEASGDDVLDSSGNARDLKTVGSPSWVAGKLNGAIQLNGSSQYITA